MNDEQLKKMIEISDNISKEQNLIIELEMQESDLKYKMFLIEQNTMSYVIGEYDAHGKNRFGNAESRQAEVAFRLDKNEEYKSLKKEISNNMYKRKLLGAGIENEKRVYDIYMKYY